MSPNVFFFWGGGGTCFLKCCSGERGRGGGCVVRLMTCLHPSTAGVQELVMKTPLVIGAEGHLMADAHILVGLMGLEDHESLWNGMYPPP